MHRFAALAVVVCLPMTLHAQSRFFPSYLDVNRVSATEFEVIEARGEGPNGIWCAAATYAFETLGKSRGRIYVATGRGPSVTQPGRKGVVFSTQPPASGVGPASNSVRQVGANLLVAHALQFCRDNIIEPGDRF